MAKAGINGAKRISAELKALTSSPLVSGTKPQLYNISPVNDDLFRWRFQVRNFDDDIPSGRQLNQDLRELGGLYGQDHLLMEITFPPDYPTHPFFLRVVSPRCVMYTGHVTAGGSFCIEALVPTGGRGGWRPDYSVEGVLVLVINNMLHAEVATVRTPTGPGGTSGPLRVDLARGRHCLQEYSPAEARAAYDRTVANHGWTVNTRTSTTTSTRASRGAAAAPGGAAVAGVGGAGGSGGALAGLYPFGSLMPAPGAATSAVLTVAVSGGGAAAAAAAPAAAANGRANPAPPLPAAAAAAGAAAAGAGAVTAAVTAAAAAMHNAAAPPETVVLLDDGDDSDDNDGDVVVIDDGGDDEGSAVRPAARAEVGVRAPAAARGRRWQDGGGGAAATAAVVAAGTRRNATAAAVGGCSDADGDGDGDGGDGGDDVVLLTDDGSDDGEGIRAVRAQAGRGGGTAASSSLAAVRQSGAQASRRQGGSGVPAGGGAGGAGGAGAGGTGSGGGGNGVRSRQSRGGGMAAVKGGRPPKAAAPDGAEPMWILDDDEDDGNEDDEGDDEGDVVVAGIAGLDDGGDDGGGGLDVLDLTGNTPGAAAAAATAAAAAPTAVRVGSKRRHWSGGAGDARTRTANGAGAGVDMDVSEDEAAPPPLEVEGRRRGGVAGTAAAVVGAETGASSGCGLAAAGRGGGGGGGRPAAVNAAAIGAANAAHVESDGALAAALAELEEARARLEQERRARRRLAERVQDLAAAALLGGAGGGAAGGGGGGAGPSNGGGGGGGPSSAKGDVLLSAPPPSHWAPMKGDGGEGLGVQLVVLPVPGDPQAGTRVTTAVAPGPTSGPASASSIRFENDVCELIANGLSRCDATALLDLCNGSLDQAMALAVEAAECGGIAALLDRKRKAAAAGSSTGGSGAEEQAAATAAAAAAARERALREEVERVMARFEKASWLSRSRIVRIERVQNWRLWTKYCIRRREVETQVGGSGAPAGAALNEFYMWHGTSKDAVQAIVAGGFDTRVAGRAGSLGEGVYFAANASYSLTYLAKQPVAGPGAATAPWGVPAMPPPLFTFGGGPPLTFNFGLALPQPAAAGPNPNLPPPPPAPSAAAFPGKSGAMMLCRVVLGRMAVGQGGLRKPPDGADSVYSGCSAYTGFGAGAGGVVAPMRGPRRATPKPGAQLLDPKDDPAWDIGAVLSDNHIVAVFDNAQAYPEYIVHLD